MRQNITSPPKTGTSVHTQETTEQHHVHASYAEYRRSLCKDEWQAAAQVYSFTDQRDATHRYDTYLRCRSYAWFARNVDTGFVTVLSSSCKLRWCPICRPALKRQIEEQTLDWLSQQNKPKFITLTLKHSNAPLCHQVSALYSYFKDLRRHKLFKASVTGGVWFFQLKYNAESEQWHPHLHILVNSKYIPQNHLSMLWLSITKSSSIVDIRAVHKKAQAINYVSRYATAPCILSDLPFPRQIEAFDALHKRRICGSFGSAKHLKLRSQPAADKSKWTNVGSWWTVTRLYHQDASAKSILDAWVHSLKLPPDISVASTDAFLDGQDLYQEELANPPPQIQYLWS